MIYFLYENVKFSSEIEYAIDILMKYKLEKTEYIIVFFDKYNMMEISTGEEDIVIFYGDKLPSIKCNNIIFILESNFFCDTYMKLESMPKFPLSRFQDLPVIYGGNEVEKKCKLKQKMIVTNIDLVASSFFMVSRYEEVIIRSRDRLGRFSAYNSAAYKENFIKRPIVNEYIELMWSFILWFDVKLSQKNLWDDKEFSIVLTHDIDSIYRYPRNIPPVNAIKKAIRRRNYNLCYKYINDYIRTIFKLKKDEYDCIDKIMELEKKFGYKSSFYFIPDKSKYFFRRYYIGSKKLKSIFLRINSNNFEVAYHTNLTSYNNVKYFEDKKLLEKYYGGYIEGVRNHCLKWDEVTSWRYVKEANLIYDTTLGFAEIPGFRAGICYPYKPYDLEERKELNVIELPLIVMDRTLDSYMKLSSSSAIDEMLELIEKVRIYNGVFVMLWHNDSFSNIYREDNEEIYIRILKYISKYNVVSETAKNQCEKYILKFLK